MVRRASCCSHPFSSSPPIAQWRQRVTFIGGTRIINEGEAGSVFYIVQRGRVKVRRAVGGDAEC